MDIKEIVNNDVNPVVPGFSCDEPLDSHRKDKIPYPLPNKHHFMAIVAPPRAGKSSLAVGLLSTKKNKKSKRKALYRGIWDKIYLIAPSSSMRSLKKNIFEELDGSQIADELNVETLERFEKQFEKNSAEDETSLLLIDDQAEQLKSRENQFMLNKLIQNRRHKKLSIWILSQVMNKIPLPTRKLIDNLILIGKPRNLKEARSIFEEMVFMETKHADAIMDYAFQKPHDNLMINTETGELFRNFNKLIFSTDNKDERSEEESDTED